MNQIVKPPETDRLPIDALALTLDALIPDLEPIVGRISDVNNLLNALDRASWDNNYRKLDVSAAVAKLNALRAQHKPDVEMLDKILTKPATKAQVKSLAGVVPKIFGKTDVTHIDYWLAAVFLLLTSVPISAPVLAMAIKDLLGESKFLPAPCEFYEACIDARRGVQRLRNEIVKLAALPPPRLPELPPPEPEPTGEEIQKPTYRYDFVNGEIVREEICPFDDAPDTSER